MGRMSEVHQDLTSIYEVLVGQRNLAELAKKSARIMDEDYHNLQARIDCIDDILVECEAMGVAWPVEIPQSNVVVVDFKPKT